MGHTGGQINPRPWRGRCRGGYSKIPVNLPCLERGLLVKKDTPSRGLFNQDGGFFSLLFFKAMGAGSASLAITSTAYL